MRRIALNIYSDHFSRQTVDGDGKSWCSATAIISESTVDTARACDAISMIYPFVAMVHVTDKV